MPAESQIGIGNRDQVHGLKQDVLPSQGKSVRTASIDINRAHPPVIRDFLGDGSVADRMRLSRTSRLQTIERDFRIVFVLGDLDVVAVGAVYKLDLDRIEDIGTRLAKHLHRIVIVLAQKIAVAQVVHGCGIRNEDRAIRDGSGVAVTLQLHHTFGPHSCAIGQIDKIVDQRRRSLLRIDHRRQKHSIRHAVAGEIGVICDQRPRPAHAVKRIREQIVHDRSRLGIGDPATEGQQSKHLVAVVRQRSRTAQVHRARGEVGKTVVTEILSGMVRCQIRPRRLRTRSSEEREGNLL